MASNLEPKINRIATAVTRALSALTAKGVTVPAGANVESLAALIESIEAGGGGYDFGGTAIEIVSGSFTVPERTICNSLFPSTSPLELPFQNLPSGYAQRGRFFILWDATKDSSNNGTAADIISTSEENDIFAVMNFCVSHLNNVRSNGAYIYRSSLNVSSGNGYWFGIYDGIYTTDSKRWFGAGKTYKWVAWATKAVWDA